jgi:hypothetical protein
MADFDYKYPIGFASSVNIDDMVIDYSAAPESTAPCWLMNIVPFSKTKTGARLFFPNHVEFSDVRVRGRQQGVRIMRIPNPHHYDLRRQGGYDGSRLNENCTLIVDDVQLEKLVPRYPNDTERVHLLIGGQDSADYADQKSLFPEIRFIDCECVNVHLGNCIASAFFDRCSINTVIAPGLQGELVFGDCRFQPNVRQLQGDLYALNSSLGTRFTNCTVHAPVVSGRVMPELVNRTGFVKINESVRYYHLNTALGSGVLDYCQRQDSELNPNFIEMLKHHHGMED